jgi:dienelactone hydrolase
MASGFHLLRPEGEGPFPAVVQMHGCGGLQPFQFSYAEAVRDAGFVVLVVDSCGPRGISRLAATLTVCTGLQLPGDERAADLFAALRWLRAQPFVDPDRLAAGGWSHGGWVVMDALAMSLDEARRCTGLTDLTDAALDGLVAAVAVYPYAGLRSRTARAGWRGRRPLTYGLLAEKDHVVGVLNAERAFARLRKDGVSVETLTLPEAKHAFDDPEASDPRTVHRPDLFEQARDFYVRSLTAAFSSNP